MSTNLDKPFKTYDEQLQLLESRNVKVEDRNSAIQFLKEFSYYTIVNGYKDTFLAVSGTECFQPGTKFNELLTLHLIDLSLNSVVMKYALILENSLKTRVSYIVAEKFGVELSVVQPGNIPLSGYLAPLNYSSSGRHRQIARSFIKRTNSLISKRINKPESCRSEALKHYILSHNHIPPWILMTELTLNDAINWYVILKSPEKTIVNKEFLQEIPNSNTLDYDEKTEFLSQAFTLIRKFRNKIAHNHKTFQAKPNIYLPKKSYLVLAQGTVSEEDYNRDFGKSDLYAVLNCCVLLFGTKYLANSLIADLRTALDPYEGYTILGRTITSIFGLPDDIIIRLQQISTAKFHKI